MAGDGVKGGRLRLPTGGGRMNRERPSAGGALFVVRDAAAGLPRSETRTDAAAVSRNVNKTFYC